MTDLFGQGRGDERLRREASGGVLCWPAKNQYNNFSGEEKRH